MPAKYKSQPWARLGVNVDEDFEPLYIISPDKKSTVTELKGLLKDVDELYLATDGDREGEAIAWHLLETLKPRIPIKRMVFHEITEQAILEAAENPRDLDIDLVDAQETRRILDRLYGYEVSPVLWKKVAPKLSAGRVQSVATRIIVQRERDRMAFRSAAYWDVVAELDASVSDPKAQPPSFNARLTTVDGLRVATGRDFDSLGALRKPDEVVVLDESSAGSLATGLRGSQLTVGSVEEKPYTRRPYPPFMTSTLQQEAGRKLRFSAERTMSIAQRLYENGYITYMRTDSTTLSQSAINAARTQARQLYGEEYVYPSARQYTRKVKNAQEAHEAIRPAGETFATPGRGAPRARRRRLPALRADLAAHGGLADGRRPRYHAEPADQRRIRRSAGRSSRASGRTLTFAGFLKAYVETVDDQAGGEADDAESRLPQLTQGQRVDATELTPDGHSTNPPARYTEASLIKALEELGIGRPSTYSSIIKTIQDRGYVHKKGSALVPSWVAFAVTGLLEQHFGRLVDYGFTAAMEDELDAIASGTERRTNWLNNFYFGGDHGVADSVARSGGLKKLVGVNLEGIDAREVNSIKLFDDAEGRAVNVRVGKNGPYLERMVVGDDGEPTPQRANLHDSLTPDELTLDVAEELFSTPQEGRTLGVDPETGHEIVAKDGRYGPYVTEVLPKPDDDDGAAGQPAKKGKKPTGPKPRTGSLLRSMDLQTVTLEDALKLLSLPRVVGVDPDSKEEITAQNGRYGPYLKRGTDSRSLATEDQMFEVTLEEALKLYAEPKRRGRQGAAAPPLRELGNDPASGKPMVIKDGRFGPYVTDGETNASLRKGDDVLSITDARASELLADRRARGPVKRTAKKTAKKAPAKKTAAKKAAKRS